MSGAQGNEDSGGMMLLRRSIDESIKSLGGPIAKTINWHMDKRGVFTDPKKIDIEVFSKNLEELVGPGAELILEETADRLEKSAGLGLKPERRTNSLSRIAHILDLMGGRATEA